MQVYAKAPDQFWGKTQTQTNQKQRKFFIKENLKKFTNNKWTLGIIQRFGTWLNLKFLNLTKEMFKYGHGVTGL